MEAICGPAAHVNQTSESESPAMEKRDAEFIHRHRPQTIPHWKLIVKKGVLNADIINHHYDGCSTNEDP